MHSTLCFLNFRKNKNTFNSNIALNFLDLKMQKYYSIVPIIQSPMSFIEKKGVQCKTYWYLANSNARLKMSHTTNRCELTSSKATGQKCREVGLLSVRQPVSGSSDSLSAPWVCLLLDGGVRGEKKTVEFSNSKEIQGEIF